MICKLTQVNKEILKAVHGIDDSTVKGIEEDFNSQTNTEKFSRKFNAANLVLKALDTRDVVYEGKKAKVVFVDVRQKVPESDSVVLHMNVEGKYVKKVLDGSVDDTVGFSLGLKDVQKLQSQADFVWNAQGNVHELAYGVSKDPKKILELVEDLAPYDRGISDEERGMLDRAIGMIAQPVADIVKTLSVSLEEAAKSTGGKITLTGRVGQVYLGASGKRNQMSVYEAYVHELYHAVTSYALSSPEAALIRKDMEDIRDSFMASKEAQKVFKDSFPDQDNAEQRLGEMLDYFADRDVGIHEFIAYSATNLGMMKALAVTNTKAAKEVYPDNASKIIGLIRKMFNWVTNSIRKRPQGDDAIQMAWLVDKLVQVNTAQVKVKKANLIQKMFSRLDKLDAMVGSSLEKLRKKAAGRPIKFPKSRFGTIMTLPMNLVRATYDAEMRKHVAMAFSFAGMEGTSTIPTILRHGMETEELANAAAQLGMQNQSYDATRENMRRTLRMRLKSNFDSEIGTAELLGLNVLLESDYVSIADKHDLGDLLDSKKLEGKITEVKKALTELTDDVGMRYFNNQVKLLAKYMVKNESNIMLLKNAKNIAMRLNSVKYKTEEADPKIEALIDEWTSLEAFQQTGLANRKTLKKLLEVENSKPKDVAHGIEEMLFMLRGIREESRREFFKNEPGASQWIKGYRVDVFDENLDIQVAPLKKEKEMKDKGYVLIGVVNNHSADRSGEQGLYKSKMPTKNRMHKVALRYKNSSARGTSFMDSYHRDNDIDGRIKAMTDIKTARNEMYKKIAAIENGTYVEEEDDDKVAPRFSEDGTVLDFNYNMTVEQKRNLLDADIDVFNVIGSMAASNYDKVITKSHNEKVLTEIVKDSIANVKRFRGEKIVGKDGHVRIWIGPKSTVDKNKELWQVMPDDAKEVFRKEEDADGKKEPDGFYIREDLANTFLGFRENSVTDFPVLRNMSNQFKYAMRVAEEIMSALVRIYKGQILLRMPEVLGVNVLSNFFSMMFFKVSPIKIMKYKLNAVKELTDYIALAKERVPLSYKVESGKASTDEVRRLSVIDNKMNSSSIKGLMDVGFYNQIMEDIEGEESGNIVKDWFGKQTEKLPTLVQDGLHHVWLPDSHALVKFMESATQYSDFVARYALHNLLVNEKGKSAKEATNIVRYMFINYTNPDSPFLHWANRIGGVMFTKYLTNVQRAIGELAKGHPITFIGLMIGQEMFMDVPDVTDSSIFVKDMYNLLYNPLESAMNAAMPGAYVLGDSLLR